MYNGNELQSDFGLGLYTAKYRTYDPAIGRWLQIDPLAEFAPDLTPYRFGFNNPILYIDPLGLFESRKAARQHAKENDIRTGLFSSSRISKQEDGSFAIVSTTVSEGNINQTFTQDFGGDIGVSTGVVVRANDKVSRDRGWLSDDVTLRDGSVVNDGHKDIGFPVGGIAAKGGVVMASSGVNIFKKISNLSRVPKGEVWWNVITQNSQKGGTYISKVGKYIRTKLLKKSIKKSRLNSSRGSPTRFDQKTDDDLRSLLENLAKKGNDSIKNLDLGG